MISDKCHQLWKVLLKPFLSRWLSNCLKWHEDLPYNLFLQEKHEMEVWEGWPDVPHSLSWPSGKGPTFCHWILYGLCMHPVSPLGKISIISQTSISVSNLSKWSSVIQLGFFCEEMLRIVKINGKPSSITLWECKLTSTGPWMLISCKILLREFIVLWQQKKPLHNWVLEVLDTDLLWLYFFCSVMRFQDLSLPCALLLTAASGVCHFQQVICEASAPLSASFIWLLLY